MLATLPEQLPLICPCCRVHSERGLELFTLALRESYVVSVDREVEEGVLVCENPSCGARFPILFGIPLIVKDPAAYLRAELPAISGTQLSPKMQAALATAFADGDPLPHILAHLSLYIEAHFGIWAKPPWEIPVSLHPQIGFSALGDKISKASSVLVPLAVELGCGVGGGLLRLAKGAGNAVGIDLHFSSLLFARRLFCGEKVTYARRLCGRTYEFPTVILPNTDVEHAKRISLICADALDPPLPPRCVGRAVAMNLFDAVPWPEQLFSVLDGLAEPAAEVLLASPYSWQSGLVEERGRFGGAAPEKELVMIWQEGRGLSAPYEILEEEELPWSLRRDGRSEVRYSVHFLRCRKRQHP